MKTFETYKKEILEKYKLENGGEVSIYMAKPTSANIRAACVLLLNKRNSIKDDHILNHFFQFKNENNKLKEIQDFDVDKFKPIVNFLKGRAKNTSTQNIELISWLIDFQPRPLQEYLRNTSYSGTNTENRIYEREIKYTVDAVNLLHENSNKEDTLKVKKNQIKQNKWLFLGSFCIVFLIILMTWLLNTKGNFNQSLIDKTINTELENRCMTWAINHYEEVSCNTRPYSKYGTEVLSYEDVKIKNFKRIDVNMATDFFAPVTNKPLIWYSKNKNGEIEYFTSPGLHPITGKTLDEITPYIIQKYVPLHSNDKDSFVK
ncbi:hypothetical protein [Cellulophaga tyrosinoxydans]|uniref:Uncharacterized protein n=1 Tax=Cellulophaga tyrosinoxydans TaxID=504486 RepID=A0A1W1YGG8_9FLAO|nr:hypothetical protein [Cellulophaga tyrosinoxydans]SMC35265.1 hypothetical protein SAMN05660703_0450 [Cellulophaga tyrosinoxydans]